MRIVGIDSSLTGLGLAAVLRHPSVPPTEAVETRHLTSKGSNKDTLTSRSLRLRRLAGATYDYARGADLIVIEGPTYASTSGAAHDRGGLWWLIVGRLTGTGHQVVEVSPTVLKTYALGKGAGKDTDKDHVLAAVIRRYLPLVEVANNNEADALVLAAMGARFAGAPIEPEPMAKTHLRAMESVRWTPIEGNRR